MNRKNIFILFGFSSAVSLVSALSFIFFGDAFTAQIYPLIVHLPLIMFLTVDLGQKHLAEKPIMADGMPHSSKAGHGFGTQSIRYVAEKLNGNCQFSVNDGWFILRVVL